MKNDDAARLRRDYEAEGLIESEMAPDPFTQFEIWFKGVQVVDLEEPNTFVLATADAHGRPSARAVLMKEFSEDGIVFYTNFTSRKSGELTENPWAAATFVWLPLHRQVRFEGGVVRGDANSAETYFSQRPRGAQIAAHASNQSAVVASREELERRFNQLENEFGSVVPRPEAWGGWRLQPAAVEFWQGRPDRFHDRLRYRLVNGGWVLERLAP
ncbi:MAG: pyridoxamine 5'-phosphate oxidase [Acidimicrobiia bacterium]